MNRAIDHLRRARRLDVVREASETLHAWTVGETAEEDLRLWAVSDAVAALGALEGDERAAFIVEARAAAAELWDELHAA